MERSQRRFVQLIIVTVNLNAMIARIGLACLILVCSVWGVAPAQAGTIDLLRAFAHDTHSATGTFTQRVSSASNKVTESSGEFVFARPGKFRWTYAKPFAQVLVSDGQKLTVYDQDLNQVTVHKLADAMRSSPVAVLFGDADLEKHFELTDGGSRDGLDWVEAVPRSHDASIEHISIGFRAHELAAMRLQDALGQTTELTFDHLARNAVVPDERFRFVVPAGADVVEN
jgi:outer membrane lipoprotein carrier protein